MTRKVKPEDPGPDPQGDRAPLETGHRAYGTTTDDNGDAVRNWSNWGSCDCSIGDDHDR